ncbi:MAG: hypothetical protein JNM58_00665 [Xanthomonadaceae bacterium]|nr:hypothetical protein [Xanthomonadaceae bacterium]
MKLPAAERTAVIDALSHPYGSAELRCDGHTVHAVVRRVSKRCMTYQVIVYVDGVLDGKHLLGKEEGGIGAKFYPTHTRRMYSEAKKLKMERQLGKRAARRYFNLDATYQYRSPCFRTGRAFLLHIEKHNESIELLSPKPEAAAS